METGGVRWQAKRDTALVYRWRKPSPPEPSAVPSQSAVVAVVAALCRRTPYEGLRRKPSGIGLEILEICATTKCLASHGLLSNALRAKVRNFFEKSVIVSV
jgi:hypothetical protein